MQISRQLLWCFRKVTTWYFISNECLFFTLAFEFRRVKKIDNIFEVNKELEFLKLLMIDISLVKIKNIHFSMCFCLFDKFAGRVKLFGRIV